MVCDYNDVRWLYPFLCRQSQQGLIESSTCMTGKKYFNNRPYLLMLFNSLASERFQWNFRYSVLFKLILVIEEWDLFCKIAHSGILMDLTGHKSTLVGSGNGLVPSGKNPLLEPMLTQFCDAIWQLYCQASSLLYVRQWLDLYISTRWGRDKMADVLQTFSSALYWIETFEYKMIFNCCIF